MLDGKLQTADSSMTVKKGPRLPGTEISTTKRDFPGMKRWTIWNCGVVSDRLILQGRTRWRTTERRAVNLLSIRFFERRSLDVQSIPG